MGANLPRRVHWTNVWVYRKIAPNSVRVNSCRQMVCAETAPGRTSLRKPGPEPSGGEGIRTPVRLSIPPDIYVRILLFQSHSLGGQQTASHEPAM
ncbi:hypothetical protein BH23GEM8_BH23GEM8_07670 [soil metagenome]